MNDFDDFMRQTLDPVDVTEPDQKVVLPMSHFVDESMTVGNLVPFRGINFRLPEMVYVPRGSKILIDVDLKTNELTIRVDHGN